MNIHFTDKSLFDGLIDSTFTKIEFGSALYGTKSDSSDSDYLCIYAPSMTQQNSFLWDHHNLQFKTNDSDYVFITLDNFIRNTMNGDMPALLEVLHSRDITNTPLFWFYRRRHWFYTYQNIKAYLGYAKRDLKYALTDDKRLCHAYRGVQAATQLMNGDYTNPIDMKSSNIVEYLNALKYNNIDLASKKELCTELTAQCMSLRIQLNERLHEKKITHLFEVEHSIKLDEWLTSVKNTEWYQSLVERNPLSRENLLPFYSALEEGVKY